MPSGARFALHQRAHDVEARAKGVHRSAVGPFPHCAGEPIGHGLPRSNNDASLLVIQTLFGWVARSEAFITALKGPPIAAAPESR